MVGTDGAEVERGLVAGELVCPGCGGMLRPWGHARVRVVRCRGGGEHRRRPRRSRCAGCSLTHVLLGDDVLCRRRDSVAVIGAALAAKARGDGYRRSARALGVPDATVRGWLRRFTRHSEAIRAFFTTLAHRLDPLLGPLAPAGTPVGDAVEAVAAAARAASLRLGIRDPWSFASAATGGRLLANTGCLWARVV